MYSDYNNTTRIGSITISRLTRLSQPRAYQNALRQRLKRWEGRKDCWDFFFFFISYKRFPPLSGRQEIKIKNYTTVFRRVLNFNRF